MRSFNLTFESGNLTGSADSFDSAVTDGGDLSNAAAAAMNGTTRGVSALIDDTTAIYGEKALTAPASNVIFLTFYFDPNTCSMPDDSEPRVVFFITDGSVGGWYLCTAWLSYETGVGYRFRCIGYNDAGSASLMARYTISDAPHCIQIEIKRATGAATNDGAVTEWIDGLLIESKTGIDNYHVFATQAALRVGPSTGIAAGTAGTLYFDEIEVGDNFPREFMARREESALLRM